MSKAKAAAKAKGEKATKSKEVAAAVAAADAGGEGGLGKALRKGLEVRQDEDRRTDGVSQTGRRASQTLGRDNRAVGSSPELLGLGMTWSLKDLSPLHHLE